MGLPSVVRIRLAIQCVCVFSSHPFWTSSSLDVPAGVTQEEGHTGFLIHLPSAVRALIFVARFLSLVDREVEFCVLTNCTREHMPGRTSYGFIAPGLDTRRELRPCAAKPPQGKVGYASAVSRGLGSIVTYRVSRRL